MAKTLPPLKGDPWTVASQIPVGRLIDAYDRIESDWDTMDHVARLRALMPELSDLPDGTLLNLWYTFSQDWMCVGCYHERDEEFVEYLIAVILENDRNIHRTHPTSLSIRLVLNGVFDGLTFDDALNLLTTSHHAEAIAR